MAFFRPRALYPILNATGDTRALLALADRLLAAGADWLQLRAKKLCARDQVELATTLVDQAARFGARIIVNDRLDVALASGASGVHLGQEDLPLEAVLPVVRAKGLVVGLSTHDIDEARHADAAGADYIGFGPIFPTPTKLDARTPQPPGALAAVRSAVDVPIVAIGGITPQTAAEVLAAGADSVAMISALTAAEDPYSLARSILALRPGPREPEPRD